MIKSLLTFLIAIILTPFASVAGSYDALCSSNQKCDLKILVDQLVIADTIVPHQAIESWSKSGPGNTMDSDAGTFLGILFGFPAAQFLAGKHQSIYTITFYDNEQQKEQISIVFINSSASQMFETELQAVTGLPQKEINEKASEYRWNVIDSNALPNTTLTP
jgi:hypothetical protein